MKNKMRTITVLLGCILVASTVYGDTAKEAWELLVDQNSRRRPEFAFVKNNPALPNVLIYGDSISTQYTQQVRASLKGKANVYRIHCNGEDSGSFVINMTKMDEKMRDEKLKGHWTFRWDVIHFNVGLHDLKYLHEGKYDTKKGKHFNSPDVYKKNIKNIITYLKTIAPKAQLIFATTTPLPKVSAGRIAGDALKYNEAALEVLKDYPRIIVNDLYAFTKPNHSKWWRNSTNVHFNKKGQTAQGREVASIVLEALNRKD